MISGDNWVVHFGSCLDVLPTLPDNSVDSVVTDPPYELGFMGKKWDSTGIAFNSDVWGECLRVLKPGGHLLAFGGSRTWHRLTAAIEDAGFEVRDSIAWLYGSGFPKSLNISKSIEAKIVTGSANKQEFKRLNGTKEKRMDAGGLSKKHSQNDRPSDYTETADGDYLRTLHPTTDEAQQWQGWGTALKPAFEPIVVARKPLIGTVAANVLEYGTGGLNIDGTRIGTQVEGYRTNGKENSVYGDLNGTARERWGGTAGERWEGSPNGRWPANVILDEYTAELLDEQADASRFFYVAKASRRDRNEGLDGLEFRTAADMVERQEGSAGMNSPRAGAGRTSGAKNFHPTVKPTTLMRYLVKLVTPPGGTVLDPFTGSGSTGKAAILEGFQFIGIELTEDYLPIIEGRLRHALSSYKTFNEKVTNGD